MAAGFQETRGAQRRNSAGSFQRTWRSTFGVPGGVGGRSHAWQTRIAALGRQRQCCRVKGTHSVHAAHSRGAYRNSSNRLSMLMDGKHPYASLAFAYWMEK